ncbi:MAG: hypothetical protein ACI8W3_003868, partial [Myxococcota bacterium]
FGVGAESKFDLLGFGSLGAHAAPRMARCQLDEF